MSALRREYDPAESAGLDKAAVENKVGDDAKVEIEKAERVKSEINKADVPKADKPPSLEQRIKRTEDRISERRAALALRTGDVSGKVRKSLSSPLLIVGAAGAGLDEQGVVEIFPNSPVPAKVDDRRSLLSAFIDHK